jgi:hypothetical protein
VFAVADNNAKAVKSLNRFIMRSCCPRWEPEGPSCRAKRCASFPWKRVLRCKVVLVVPLAAMLVAVGCAKLFRHNKEACTLQNGTSALHGCPDAVSGKLRFSISPLVAVYVEATNGFDLERWVAAFAHDALVNIELQAYWDKPASSECAKRDIIGG